MYIALEPGRGEGRGAGSWEVLAVLVCALCKFVGLKLSQSLTPDLESGDVCSINGLVLKEPEQSGSC